MAWSDEEEIDDVEDDEGEVDVEDDEDEEEDDDDDDMVVTGGRSATYSVYKRKYNLLMERCEAIQQDNERLVSRVREVKRLWRRSMKERKFLMDRLDTHGDNFRNVPLIWPPEEDPANVAKKQAKEKKMKKGLTDSPHPTDSPLTGEKSGKPGRGRKSKGDKEKKQPRDPNLPKRPQNPFFQFCREQRENVAKEVLYNQSVNLTKKELTKVLATRWNQLNAEEKQIYNQKFEEEKVGYNQRMEIYRRLKVDAESSAVKNSVMVEPDVRVANFDIDDSFD